jgi:hypothetical protein
VQRFIPNVVVPVAPFAVHVDHVVEVSNVLASAHVTIKVRGRTTEAPEQVTTFTLWSVVRTKGVEPDVVGVGPAVLTPTAIADAATPTTTAPATNFLVRRRRWRCFASLKRNSILGSHGSVVKFVMGWTSGTLGMKLV